MGTPQPFQILKMDRRRGNIVVSRRAVLEDSRANKDRTHSKFRRRSSITRCNKKYYRLWCIR